MLQESILQYFRPSLSYHLLRRPLFCLFLGGRLRQVLHVITNIQFIDKLVSTRHTMQPTLSDSACQIALALIPSTLKKLCVKIFQHHFTYLGLMQIR